MDFAPNFITKQINPRCFRSWCVKGTEESASRVNSSVPLTPHNRKHPRLIFLVKKRKIHFQILSDLRIQSWIFLKKRTLRLLYFICRQDNILNKTPNEQ